VSNVPARLSAVTVGVRDFESMRSFYRGLGWAEGSSSGEPYAVFRTAGAFLALFPIDSLAEDAQAPPPTADGGFRGQTFAMYVERPELVDETIAALRTAGVRVVKEPGEAFGGRSAYFADPEDNRWEVAWLSSVRFHEHGALRDL
jgi:catechol 2,3-dioxygenase-like lactoylglutathione lyase family enzyme